MTKSKIAFFAIPVLAAIMIGATVTPVYALGVDIDISPGGDPNSINLASKGVIPVAILGSAEFDAATIDPTSLLFGPTGAAPAHNAGGHLVDVNDDGFLDLVSHYRTQETGITEGDNEACVTGETFGGLPIDGCDDITTVPTD